MVKVTIIVLPAATPPAGTVTLMLVLEVVELFFPILVNVGTVVTWKAPVKVLEPVLFPVMIIFFNPTVRVGTVIVPERLPLLFTDRVLVAVTPPTVTPEMISETAQPDPVTVITVPTGPDV